MMPVQQFLRMRRQSDGIKAGLLLFLLGAILLAVTCRHAIVYYRMLRTPYELLLSDMNADSTDSPAMQMLRARDDVAAVSRQTETVLTVNGIPLTVTQLSPEYLSSCYGITAESTQSVWVNAIAAASLPQENGSVQSSITCETEHGKTAYRFAVCSALPEDMPHAVGTASRSALNGAETVRVMLRMQDPDGHAVQEIQSLGFTLQNDTALQASSYEQQLMLCRLGYGLLSALLAVIGGAAFYVPARKKYAYCNHGTSVECVTKPQQNVS